MQTFLSVKFALAPIVVFLALLGASHPGLAIAAGFLLSAALCAWRWFQRELKSLEAGSAAVFFALGAGMLIAPGFVGTNAATLCFVGLALVCLASVALRRPWTADYARARFAEMAQTPTFFAVNMSLSALWGALFLAIAVARALGAHAWVPTAIVAVGAMASIFGPGCLVRLAVARQLAAREGYRWPAPSFGHTNDGVDVAVVGAGIGGLCAAALLADFGLRVLVAEHHVVPGGFCHTFLRKAHHAGAPRVYRFDAGPHDFSGLWPGGPVDSVLRRLGVDGRIEWQRLDHTYHLDGMRVDVPREWREYVQELGGRFPQSAAGFATLFEDIRTIYESMYATGRGNGGIPGLPASVKAALAFPRDHPLAFHWLGRPFEELLAKHLQDPAARRMVCALAGYLGDRKEPLSCAQMVPVFGYYFHGGFYPLGGSGKLADVLAAAIRERGGEIRLKARVDRIAVEHGRAAGIVLGDGSRIDCRAVVSNADLKRTFLELVEPRHLPADFLVRMQAARPANSAFMVHLGVDFVPDTRPALHVSGDPDVGIEVLSLVDPTAAPPGHSTVGIVTLLPHQQARTWFPTQTTGTWDDWRQSTEYAQRKTKFGDRMIVAAERVIPGLSARIVFRADASPVTYARYDWASDGSIYGVSSAGRLNGAKSPIPGLVVAGSGTHGAGVEAAVISGALAAKALVPGVLQS